MASNWNFTDAELLEICSDLDIQKKYSLYITYRLYSDDTETIHSNYIKKLDSDNIENGRVHMYFDSENAHKFLNNGFTANNISMLIQAVRNMETDSGYVLVPPKSNKWKEIDVTDQISGSGTPAENIRGSNYFIDIPPIEEFEEGIGDFYDLDYINYPNQNTDRLTFGDEIFFFGNIKTEIQAIAHSTDLPIKLPMNEYNTSTNPTWDGESSVYISEIGLYDDENNLVAIAKLNRPIEKNSQISRTIIFSMDF